MRKRILLLALLVITAVITLRIPGSAASSDYDYAINTFWGTSQPIPKSYELKETVYNLGEFGNLNQPKDLFVKSSGLYFVADTANNRIIRLGSSIQEYKGEDCGGFSAPEGVYVNSDNAVLVGDTGKARIVHLDSNGKFIEEITLKRSSLLEENFIFAPKRIAMTDTGMIYAIRHQSLMSLNSDGTFRGYIGTTKVGFDFFYTIRYFFSNETQRTAMGKREPPSCISFALSGTDDIFITTAEKSGQLKQLNAIGKNIYAKTSAFGETEVRSGGEISPNFVDVAIDGKSNAYLLEQRTGRIYIYDPFGNNLAAFGGIGDSEWEFGIPVAIDVDENGCVYVLDEAKNNLKIFEPTRFITLVKQATSAFEGGDYKLAEECWRNVLSVNESYHLANQGIGNAAYKSGDYKKAMEYFSRSNDKAGYSKAFDKYEHKYYRENFVFIFLTGVAVAVLLVFLLVALKRFTKREIARHGHLIH